MPRIYMILFALFSVHEAKILIEVNHDSESADLSMDFADNNRIKDRINARPIIGVLAQETLSSMDKFTNKSSYIASSYVKFVESAGTRVVPILINQPDKYYAEMASYVNGFLFPGGALPIDSSSGYGRAGRKILREVMAAADRGEPIPLWGTCLGFEMILYLMSPVDPRVRCQASNIGLALKFNDEDPSRLFSQADAQLMKALSEKNITSNFHHFCVLPSGFEQYKLNESFRIISTSVDQTGQQFVSTIEHRHYPIYASQWHPEKAAFEWTQTSGHSEIPHQFEAIQSAQYLSNFFAQQARKNRNRFASLDSELQAMIHNYEEVYLAPSHKSPFDQIYLL